MSPGLQVTPGQFSATEHVQRLYYVNGDKLLGKGQFGSVYLAHNKNATDFDNTESEKESDEAKFAIKIVNLKEMKETTKQ